MCLGTSQSSCAKVSADVAHAFHALTSRKDLLPKPARRLAGSDVETQGRRVPVLKEVEAETALRAELDRLPRASLALHVGNDVAVARLDGDGAEVLAHRWCVAPGGLTNLGRGAELGEADATGAGEGVGASLEVLLLREEEDDGALFALVALRNVEVEDGGGSAVDLTEVGGAIGGILALRGDRDDGVRSLVGAGKSGLAGRARGGRAGRGGLSAGARDLRLGRACWSRASDVR